jgi:hypothetical protein
MESQDPELGGHYGGILSLIGHDFSLVQPLLRNEGTYVLVGVTLP